MFDVLDSGLRALRPDSANIAERWRSDELASGTPSEAWSLDGGWRQSIETSNVVDKALQV